MTAADLPKEHLRNLVNAYIAAYADESSYDPGDPGIQDVIDLAYDKPELCWTFIINVLYREPSQKVIGALAAGPLDDLIEDHGDQFIDRIEDEARQDPAFRHLLGGVWESGTHEVWNRVLRARNNKSW